jgi:hypothetical protein
MQRRSGTRAGLRAKAVVLTLLAHAVFLLLLGLEKGRTPRSAPALERQYVSIWPELRRQPAALPAPRNIRPPRITIAPASSVPPAVISAEGGPPAQPPVDWNAAVTQVASRIAREAGGQKSFGPTRQALREPCTPRQLDAQTKQMMAERLPEPTDPPTVGPDPTANCLVVGGRPMCVQKIVIAPGGPDATKELMQNMRSGRKVASVPSAGACD